MRYLLLNASPHRGNTWVLASLLREEIQSIEPTAIFEEIQLAELNLPFCQGCSACFRLGKARCPHRNVMDSILEQIDRCDGLIFAFTTFNMQPNALAKNLIDHLCYLLHRPHFFTKKAIVVTTVGGVGGGKAAGYASGWLKAIGFNRCYRLAVRSKSWNDYRPGEAKRRQCARLAARFQADVASGKLKSPSFMVSIPYNLFRGMSIAYAKGTPYATEDGVHWLDEKRARRAYDLAVPLKNPLKIAVSAVFYGIGKIGGKLKQVTYRKA